MNVLSAMYGAAATWRRDWYARDPTRTRRLGRPVVSVGNLRVGGSGKTPVVAHLARLLLEHGERPSILTRGYARRRAQAGVTVVSDRSRILADVASAGDEPFMLARALPGVPVLVGRDRFLSGSYAEREFDVTVHLLDDGFQHVKLARNVDVLLVDAGDLEDCVLPVGRLREPLAAAKLADIVLVTAANRSVVDRVARELGVESAFMVTRALHRPRSLTGETLELSRDKSLVALAGIARPDRFFAEVRAAGWHVADTLAFSDHHPFTQRDVERLRHRAHAAGAALVLTTEKDAVRLMGLDVRGLTIAYVPLTASVEPAGEFAAWLMQRLRAPQ